MTLRHFTIFRALCRNLNMTRTAEELCMTQPSVSQVVAELEAFYRVRLFDRLGKKIFLTAEGSDLLARVNDILNLCKSTEKLFADKAERRSVRIGASATVGSFLLPAFLRSVRERDPGLEVNFMVANTAQIEALLLHSELDAAIVEGRTQSSALRKETVLKDELVLAALPELLPKQRPLSARSLETLPFLLREQGSGTAEQAGEILAEWKIEPRIAGRVTGIDALRRLVLAGAGLAFLPKIAVAQDIGSGALAEVRVGRKKLERNFRFVWHRARRLSADLQLVRECALALRE